jgi:DNA polymerase/3'-5' exonuclease PolX
MKFVQAKQLAEKARSELVPYCHRVEIAGSIRRQKPEVGDIELVVIPKGASLMGFVDAVNRWPKIKGTPKGKYTQREYHGMKLDLFICTPNTWACNFAIRTGSAEFSHSLAIRARQVGMCFKDARLWRHDMLGPIPDIIEELDVFKALRIDWVEPEERVSARLIIPLASVRGMK